MQDNVDEMKKYFTHKLVQLNNKVSKRPHTAHVSRDKIKKKVLKTSLLKKNY